MIRCRVKAKNLATFTPLTTKISTAGKALFWSGYDALGHQLLSLAISLLLTRLLLPQDFGVMAALVIFISLTNSIIHGGFSLALIQRETVTPIDFDTVFTANLLFSGLLFVLLCLVSPLLAVFFRNTLVSDVAVFVGLSFLAQPFIAAQICRLTRELNFRKLAFTNLVSIVIGGTCAVVMALLGYAVWALVLQLLVTQFLRAILLSATSEWQYRIRFDWARFRALMQFSNPMILSGVLNSTFSNIYYVAIGRAFGIDTLGHYGRARHFQEVPSHALTNAVARVALPMLAQQQHSPDQQSQLLQRCLRALLLINTPALLGLALVARPFVDLVLTSEWLMVVPYLQLLVIIGILFPFHAINLTLLQSVGRSDLFLRIELFKQALTVLNIVITSQISISAIIFGQITVSLIAYYLNSRYTVKYVSYGLLAQVKDFLRVLVPGVGMVVCVLSLNAVNWPEPFFELVTKVSVGTLSYVIFVRVFCYSMYKDLVKLILRDRN